LILFGVYQTAADKLRQGRGKIPGLFLVLNSNPSRPGNEVVIPKRTAWQLIIQISDRDPVSFSAKLQAAFRLNLAERRCSKAHRGTTQCRSTLDLSVEI